MILSTHNSGLLPGRDPEVIKEMEKNPINHFYVLFLKNRIIACFLITLLLALFFLSSCRSEFDYFTAVGGRMQTDLEDLFSLLEKYNTPDKTKERFVINKQIIDLYTNAELDSRKILYLTYIVQKYETDPFNAYYLAIVAQTYQRQGALLFAKYYYEKVVTSFDDLFFSGQYVHQYCLNELTRLASVPEEKITWYRELLSRFETSIDKGEVFFNLAQAYEDAGDYASAQEMYKNFLNAPPVKIAGSPDAYNRVKEKLTLYEKKPDWILQDLNELVRQVREAIEDKNVSALESFRAKDYFFTLTWEQKNDPAMMVFTEASMADYIGAFLLNSNVTVAPKFDIDSNAREAYLRTENWVFQIHPTWYFYFRKVDFKPDPDINGGWEWAGIYFGEKL
jgi:tetratricopeptide (TPR) repeat protein